MAGQQQQPPAAGPAAEIQLHATWWQVLKPKMVVLATGQPAYEVVGAYETLAEATAHVRPIPGGVIVLNSAVFINPKAAPLPGLRPQ